MSNDQAARHLPARPTPSRGVRVVLDRERYLRFPIGVLRRLFANAGDDDFSFGQLLYEGLRGDDPDLTVDMIENDIVTLADVPGLREPLLEATGKLVDVKLMFPTMFGEMPVMALNPPVPVAVDADTPAEPDTEPEPETPTPSDAELPNDE